MWFIGVEVEQETSAPPPKKNPGSAPDSAPNFWHLADDFKAWHSQFLMCKLICPKCNVAPVLKLLGVPRLPLGGSLGTGKQGTVPKIWCAVLTF